MSSPHVSKSTKRWAIIATTAHYAAFLITCAVTILSDDSSYKNMALVVLFSLFLMSHMCTLLFNREFIKHLYKNPITDIKHHLINQNESLRISNPDDYGHLKGLVLAINNGFNQQESKNFEAQIIQNSENPLVVVDGSGVIVFSNPAFCSLFQTKAKSAANRSLSETISKHSKEIISEDILTIEEKDGSDHAYQKKVSELSQEDHDYQIIEFQNIDQVVSLKARLDDRFKTDELTSLNTRFHFNDIADEIIINSKESNYLALIDINDFKMLNDSAGHDIGDVILMELANIVGSFADEADITGRISGDEFAILFCNKGLGLVERKLVDLYKAIKSYRIEHFDTQIGVSVSIGVTKAAGGKDFAGVKSLLQEADFAVMTARKNGFMFKVYDEDDSDIVFYREAPIWINRIKSAINHDTFDLFVQEITPFDKSKELHLEVLLRMKNEKGGYYSPMYFLDVAEKFNLTKQIDEWVVVNTFKRINDGTMSDCRISINLSGDTIKDKLSIDRILYYAKFHQINASKVVFEITETMAIDDINQAISNINTLRIEGFSIALDDFGSGFSTFKYIQNIPADYIKIDGSFVKNASRNDRDKAIVSNVVSIAHELGMSCVAEFVEDKDTMDLMRTLGVDYIQGYYVHKPLPVTQWHKEKAENALKITA